MRGLFISKQADALDDVTEYCDFGKKPHACVETSPVATFLEALPSRAGGLLRSWRQKQATPRQTGERRCEGAAVLGGKSHQNVRTRRGRVSGLNPPRNVCEMCVSCGPSPFTSREGFVSSNVPSSNSERTVFRCRPSSADEVISAIQSTKRRPLAEIEKRQTNRTAHRQRDSPREVVFTFTAGSCREV